MICVPVDEHANKSATLYFTEDRILVLGRNIDSGINAETYPNQNNFKSLSRAHSKLLYNSSEQSLCIEPQHGNSVYVNGIETSSPIKLNSGDIFYLMKGNSGVVTPQGPYLFGYEVKADPNNAVSSSGAGDSILLPARKKHKLESISSDAQFLDPSLYECPFCFEILAYAHSCSCCGNSICYICARDLARDKKNGKCLTCKAIWKSPSDIIPNRTLDSMIRAIIEKRNEAHQLLDLDGRVRVAVDQRKSDEKTKDFSAPSLDIPRVVAPPRSGRTHPLFEENTQNGSINDLRVPMNLTSRLIAAPFLFPVQDLTGGVGIEAFETVSVGRSIVSSRCLHCSETITEASLRLEIVQASGKKQLHFSCVRPFNSKLKQRPQGQQLSYLHIIGRDVLSDTDRDELRRAIRSS